jgi:hypothetical protein
LEGGKEGRREGTTWSRNKALDLYVEELGFIPGRDTVYTEVLMVLLSPPSIFLDSTSIKPLPFRS